MMTISQSASMADDVFKVPLFDVNSNVDPMISQQDFVSPRPYLCNFAAFIWYPTHETW